MDSTSPPTQEEANRHTKIVIVEDKLELAEIYQTKLQADGYDVFVANDGITALYIIQKETPNLVLLDLMVPDVAGDEILRRMRTSDWGKTIPVVIISNLNEADAPSGIRDLGISGYAVKANLSLDQFSQMVSGVLSHPLPAPAPQSPQPAAPPPPAPIAGPPVVPPPEEPMPPQQEQYNH